MKVRHLHLAGLTRYAHASAIQSGLVPRLLAQKANPSASNPPQPPTIITAEFQPVYTCGRREIGTITASQLAHLTAATSLGQAEFHEALRGGQTTFHGPGQLVAYPILDLRRHGLTARCYVHFLEHCVMQTCSRYGVSTQRTSNPGVWADEDHKICAVGVHLRRNVSSHGIGLNISTDMAWFERIEACGLAGKQTTSLALQGVDGLTVEDAGNVFVEKMAEGLEGVDGTVKIAEEDDPDGPVVLTDSTIFRPPVLRTMRTYILHPETWHFLARVARCFQISLLELPFLCPNTPLSTVQQGPYERQTWPQLVRLSLQPTYAIAQMLRNSPRLAAISASVQVSLHEERSANMWHRFRERLLELRRALPFVSRHRKIGGQQPAYSSMAAARYGKDIETLSVDSDRSSYLVCVCEQATPGTPCNCNSQHTGYSGRSLETTLATQAPRLGQPGSSNWIDKSDAHTSSTDAPDLAPSISDAIMAAGNRVAMSVAMPTRIAIPPNVHHHSIGSPSYRPRMDSLGIEIDSRGPSRQFPLRRGSLYDSVRSESIKELDLLKTGPPLRRGSLLDSAQSESKKELDLLRPGVQRTMTRELSEVWDEMTWEEKRESKSLRQKFVNFNLGESADTGSAWRSESSYRTVRGSFDTPISPLTTLTPEGPHSSRRGSPTLDNDKAGQVPPSIYSRRPSGNTDYYRNEANVLQGMKSSTLSRAAAYEKCARSTYNSDESDAENNTLSSKKSQVDLYQVDEGGRIILVSPRPSSRASSLNH